MKKSCLAAAGLLVLMILGGCGQGNTNDDQKESKKMVEKVTLQLNTKETFQTIESFGASGAWWSQDVGGWQEKENGQAKRDRIAELLFDQKKGIGLSSYRYNLGSGSADSSNSPKISDPWRKGVSFETAPGVYDWDKDENARYMLEKAVAYGVEDIYLFANSPLERLTKSGAAYGENNDGDYSNLAPENYHAFNNYLFDVTEHFLAEGIPVKYLSPINEPQWEWLEGQEGCHYEPAEVVAFAKQIYQEKQQRAALANVELSVPELGEWGNSSLPYFDAMTADADFMKMYPVWDVHSYWSNEFQKADLVDYLKDKNLDVTLKMSEWTEMVNGKDVTMDSALIMANTIYEDLTTLNVTDWQYWIAVSCYDYRDGLIYVDPTDHSIETSKRLWAMGNFSKFIRPGAQRVAAETTDPDVKVVAFAETEADEVTIVAINNGTADKTVPVPEGYQLEAAYETSDEADLKKIKTDQQQVTVPVRGIVTLQMIMK